MPRTIPGDGNLDASAARALAESTAGEWGVDLSEYTLLDSSEQTLPAGRVDHTFVFERTDASVADARFRLRVGVAGSRPSELTHFVYVPEAFSRRYSDMRSTNDTIALAAQSGFMILFVLLGAGVGSAILLRRGWLQWRTALAWGTAIAFVFGLNAVNGLPLSWMSYDTAVSSTNFVLRQLAGGLAIALLGAPLIGFVLLAGESLGRRAFPDHVQQWRFWSRDVASSTTALGMTGAAYALVGIQLGYVVLFYLGTQRLDGWWSPADALVEPDLLATYLPWLQAFSTAFFASFWEESVFRAVPIACAALLGERFGRRRAWIWGAVALQAVVFAAGHANYPQQPPYARVVELIGPALVWGAVYVRFGLVPTILTHFLYDLSLTSVVLFESHARIDQAVIVALGLVPLGVVLWARSLGRARAKPPEEAYNRAWAPARPAPAAEPGAPGEPGLPPEAGEPPRSGPVPRRSRIPAWTVPVAGIAGLALWTGAQVAGSHPPRLWGSRADALSVAASELRRVGAPVDAWSLVATTSAGASMGRQYAFEEATGDDFAALDGAYFGAPQWIVRLVDWGADPAARVEEYRVWVGREGRVTRLLHVIPESREGASLAEDSARTLARGAIADRLSMDVGALREVEAQETSRPHRTDWTFTYTDPRLLVGLSGEARIQVRLAGDEVVDIARSVRVPEEWARERRETESRRLILGGGLGLLVAIFLGAAAVAAIVVWSRRALVVRPLRYIAAAVALALVVSMVNAWPATAAGFSTAQPWTLQAATQAMVVVLVVLVAAPAAGLIGALAETWLGDQAFRGSPTGSGIAFGLFLGGSLAGASLLASSPPPLGDYQGAASWIPVLAEPARSVTPYLLIASSLLLFVAARERFRHVTLLQTALWTVVAAGAVVLVPADLEASLLVWLGAAAAIGVGAVVGLGVCVEDPALAPGIAGTVGVLEALSFAWSAPHEGARAGGVIAALVTAALAWVWTRRLSARPSLRATPPAGSVGGGGADLGR